MKLTCVGSGSEMGNAYVLEQNGSRLILDIGRPWRELVKACEYDVLSINAVLITHEHGDHTKYMKDLKTAGIPIFSNGSVKEKFPYVRVLPKARSADVGGWKVIPFEVPHTNSDGSDCQNYAYLIEKSGERLLYLTDWMYCPYNLSRFGINHFLIAINYTELEEEDEDSKIRHVVKGHSSIDTAIEFLKVSMTDACKNIIACHLSQRNACQKRILFDLVEIAPETVNVAIARKGETYKL